jgi:hypothetical protein
MSVARPNAAARPGSPVVVSGLVRDVSAPMLEKLAENGAWVRSCKLVPDGDGQFAVTVRPRITATYRLTAEGQVVGPAVTVAVPG